MKIQLTITGTDKDGKEQSLEMKKESLESDQINISIGYQDITLSQEQLQEAINYLKAKRGINT